MIVQWWTAKNSKRNDVVLIERLYCHLLTGSCIAYKNLIDPMRFKPRISWIWILSFSGRLSYPFSRRTVIVLPKFHMHITFEARRMGRSTSASFLTTQLQPKWSSQFQTAKDWEMVLNHEVLANKMPVIL